jgi:hypothetical protein
VALPQDSRPTPRRVLIRGQPLRESLPFALFVLAVAVVAQLVTALITVLVVRGEALHTATAFP